MIGKLALACAGLLSLVYSTPAVPTSLPLRGTFFSEVKQVICERGKGSAFIADYKVISVAHVTNNAGCSIDGEPIAGVQEGALDFSIIGPSKVRGFKINCDGFVPGQWYFSVGYARGWPWQTMIMLLATYKTNELGWQVLFGSPSIIPGMSGAMVLNAAGEAVGVNNAYVPGFPISFSLPLSETSLCKEPAVV